MLEILGVITVQRDDENSKMAASDEVEDLEEVNYYTTLNVSKEVK
jgi:hypothetical protein